MPSRRLTSFAPLFLVAASTLAACWGSEVRVSHPAMAPVPDATLSYARWQQKSVHNAYERDESLADQLAVHGFRSLELDVHRERFGEPTLPGEWYVYHADFPGFDRSSCATLAECLAPVAAYHRRVPDHDVLTLFVDLKQDFEAPRHRPQDFDDRIRSSLPPGALLEPRELLTRCGRSSTLRAAVTGACSWPSVGELRGRILVVTTGGDLCAEDGRLASYVAGGREALRRAAFVAPRVSDDCPFVRQDRASYAIFFNLDLASIGHAPAISRAGLVSRAYGGGIAGGLDDPEAWSEAAAAGIQILATDRVDRSLDPWTDRLAPSL